MWKMQKLKNKIDKKKTSGYTEGVRAYMMRETLRDITGRM